VRRDYLGTIERRLGEQDECEKHTDAAQWTGSPGQSEDLGDELSLAEIRVLHFATVPILRR
jgi:hypothetical protein